MNRPRNCHSEWSKSEWEKQILYNIADLWNLKKWYRWTCLQSRNRIADAENKLMVAKRGNRGWDELGDWDWYIQYTNKYKIGNIWEPTP